MRRLGIRASNYSPLPKTQNMESHRRCGTYTYIARRERVEGCVQAAYRRALQSPVVSTSTLLAGKVASKAIFFSPPQYLVTRLTLNSLPIIGRKDSAEARQCGLALLITAQSCRSSPPCALSFSPTTSHSCGRSCFLGKAICVEYIQLNVQSFFPAG